MRDRIAAAVTRTRWAALPGVVVAALLWAVTWFRWGGASEYAGQQLDYMWQSLGRAALRDDPIGSLLALHIQPPGLNALYAVDMAVTPDRHLLLLGLYAVLMLLTIVLLVDTLIRVGVSGSWATVAGLLYALLPATVIYSLWIYVVTPMAALAMASIWGVAAMRRQPLLGSAVSAFSMLGLVLLRPTFAWFVLLLWCVALIVLIARAGRRPSRIVAITLVGVAAALGVVVQAHYVTSFGLPVMSSWSGENLAKALATSKSLVVTEGAQEAAGDDPCLAAMLAAYREDRLNRWDWEAFRGLPECRVIDELPDRGTAAWDEPVKAESTDPNFNYRERLVASRKWTELMTIVVREHPQQLLRMALTTEYGPTGSGLSLYLSPSEDYPFVTEIRDAMPTSVPGGLLSLLVPVGMWLLVIVGWVHAAVVRTSRLRREPVFWLASALLTFHLVTNILLEYSENMRYRAEVEPVLIVAGFMALYAIWRARPDGDDL